MWLTDNYLNVLHTNKKTAINHEVDVLDQSLDHPRVLSHLHHLYGNALRTDRQLQADFHMDVQRLNIGSGHSLRYYHTIITTKNKKQ